MLNANIAFLAIPSVDEGVDIRTPQQIMSYISTICDIGSIIIALLLVRRYSGLSPDPITKTVTRLLQSGDGFVNMLNSSVADEVMVCKRSHGRDICNTVQSSICIAIVEVRLHIFPEPMSLHTLSFWFLA